jgi:ATP-dependent DNA helicase Q1
MQPFFSLFNIGITLVVSPLVSLMEDQLISLQKLGIQAALLNASSSKDEVNFVHNVIISVSIIFLGLIIFLKAMTDHKSTLKLIYVTPEKLAKSKRFMAKLQKMFQLKRFARLAVDEVHCCSQWGHDFRPGKQGCTIDYMVGASFHIPLDYKFLGVMRSLFPGVSIMGLTATATARVTTDVQKILNLNSCLIFKASFNRPNLYYEVSI